MSNELDQSLLLKIGELIGQVAALHGRFNAVDVSIAASQSFMGEQLRQHEARENDRFAALELQLEKVKRLVWLGFGGVSAIATVAAIAVNLPRIGA